MDLVHFASINIVLSLIVAINIGIPQMQYVIGTSSPYVPPNGSIEWGGIPLSWGGNGDELTWV